MDNSNAQTTETEDLVELDGSGNELESVEPIQTPPESSLLPDPGTLPRKRGRPRLDSMPPGSAQPLREPIIPSPLYRTFRSESRNPNQTSKTGWDYWNNLPEYAKRRIDAYVYRDHPPLLEPPEKEDGSKQYPKYIDKIPGSTPIQDDLDLLNRYGCGSYHLTLSETASTKREDKAICNIWVTNVGGSDYRSNPPTDDRIRDVEQVDLNNPACKSYAAYLRGEKKLPGQFDVAQQENEMANAQLIDKLVDKITEDRDRVPRQDDSSKRNMEINNELTKAAIQTMKEVNAYALKTRDEIDAGRPTPVVTPPATPSENPMTLALEIVKLIRDDRNPASNAATDARYEALQLQLSQMQNSQIDSLREQVKVLMEAKVTTPAASTSPFAAMKEGLESLEQFNGVMERLKGSTEKEETVTEAVGDLAPKWLRPFMPLVPLFGQAIGAFLQYRQQSAMMPQQVPQPPYYPQGYPTGPMPQPQLGLPQPQQQPMPPQSPTQIDNPNNLPPPAIEVLSGIKDSLAFHMDYGMTGSEFAGWYVRQVGEPRYKDVASLGSDQIMQLLSLYPPTSRTISGQKPEYVQEFVSEFCNPKMEEGDEEEETETETQSPAI